MLGTYHLTALFDILNKLHFIYEPNKLWQFVLEQAVKTLQAEAGTFFESSEDEQTLRVSAAHGIAIERLISVPFKVGVGVCGWVAQYHQPALVNDVRGDNRFSRQVDLLTGFTTKSILCVPVFSMKKTYGALEILNRRVGPFSPQDQEFMTLLGRQAAVAYQNLLLIAEVQHKENLLGSVLGNLSGGLLAMDGQGMLTIANPASLQLLGLDPETKPGKPVAITLKDHGWLLDLLKKTLDTRETVSRQEVTATIGGESRRIGYTTILVAAPDKTVLGSGIIFQKLT